jgi:hypothetical protein
MSIDFDFISFKSIILIKGKHFDGVWHTGVVAFGQEWYFGNEGISSCHPVNFNLQ